MDGSLPKAKSYSLLLTTHFFAPFNYRLVIHYGYTGSGERIKILFVFCQHLLCYLVIFCKFVVLLLPYIRLQVSGNP